MEQQSITPGTEHTPTPQPQDHPNTPSAPILSQGGAQARRAGGTEGTALARSGAGKCLEAAGCFLQLQNKFNNNNTSDAFLIGSG